MTSLYNEACSEYDKGNYSVAYDAFYTLAVAHDVSCQMNVANMLLHGIGTAENRDKAYEWYKQAAYNDESAQMISHTTSTFLLLRKAGVVPLTIVSQSVDVSTNSVV